MCKVVGAGEKFYFEHTQFVANLSFFVLKTLSQLSLLNSEEEKNIKKIKFLKIL